jgi:hypothetical protein
LSDRDGTDPLAFALEADEIERGAAAAGIVGTTQENMPRWRATNAKGELCRAPYTLVGGDGYCAMHRPGDAQENRRRRRQGGGSRPSPNLGIERPLATRQDIGAKLACTESAGPPTDRHLPPTRGR